MTDPLTIIGALVGAGAISTAILSRSFTAFRKRLTPRVTAGLVVGGFLLYGVSLVPVPVLTGWVYALLIAVVAAIQAVAVSVLTRGGQQT